MNIEKQLKKAYKKRLNSLNKNFFEDSNSGLNIFVEHLKFRRDCLILQPTNENVIATLATAVTEFESYKANKDIKHWNNFCNLVKLNMEEWQILNDSV